MSKAWELTLYHRNPDNDFSVKSWNKIEADDIIQLLAQFMVLLASIQKKETDAILNELRLKDDDIPF